ncbi:MAG: hypothetical protein ACRCVJ_15475 [Clostridium sp.]|uniref:hypothetical protein n=1 Tax=Clostridium sp. TaxID=1506 RepID=UPI003F2AA6E5
MDIVSIVWKSIILFCGIYTLIYAIKEKKSLLYKLFGVLIINDSLEDLTGVMFKSIHENIEGVFECIDAAILIAFIIIFFIKLFKSLRESTRIKL